MQIYYLSYKKIIATVLLIALTSCESNPSHRPAIGGDIKLINNKELCFSPVFETAHLTSTIAFNDLKFINLSYIRVLHGEDPLANNLVWEASPKSTVYYQLKKGDAICINQRQSELAVVEYKYLKSGNHYTVVIGGMDNTQKYNLRFMTRFEYPLQQN